MQWLWTVACIFDITYITSLVDYIYLMKIVLLERQNVLWSLIVGAFVLCEISDGCHLCTTAVDISAFM